MLGGAVDGVVVVALVIGGLELFDRTSFAMISLAARSHPWGTWSGGASAFVLTTALAVGLGAGLASLVGPAGIGWLRVAGGSFLIAYALWIYLRHEAERPLAPIGARTAFVAAFATIALLELGDTTMIFEIVFVANFGWLAVLIGGVLGLVTVAAFDVWLGRQLAGRLEPARLEKLVVAVLLVVGAVTIAYGLDPSAFPAF